MRRLLRTLTRRMAVKIFLAMGLIVGQSLIVLAFLQSREEVASLRQATRVAAQQIGRLVQGSIEHAMLQGDGIAVKALVAGFKERLPEAEIRIHDRRGLEVFGAPPPQPAPSSLPAPLQKALRDGERVVDATGAGRVYRPLPNEERCHACHAPESAVRGVLAFTPASDVLARDREKLALELVRAGFVHVMTARQSDRLDDYFAELPARAPSVRAVGVYDREGDLAFGKDLPEVPREALRAALEPGAARARVPIPGGAALLLPLPREPRCAACHKDGAPVRGVLAVALAEPPAPNEVEGIVDTTLRAIMVSSLGRIIAEYLHEVAATGALGDELVLYDAEGRTYFTSSPQPTDPAVAAALAEADLPPQILGADGQQRVMLAQRLENGERCITCHGDDHPIRGVVLVSLPDRAANVREAAITRTVVLSSLALILILVMLYGFLAVLVDRPVREIGAVARAVGQGDLSTKVSFADPEGDEIRVLGTRINDMITELRTKFVLQKFVSKGAAAAAASGARTSAASGMKAGERRHLTVLFSDIRGFTAFSETVPPEVVVELLNAFLEAQAQVVEKWGGDVDKFVGDELMAVFQGDDAARRAVRCGVEMLEAVERIKKPGQDLAVGVGVSTGDMVYGPIGAKNRLDFTVIGDVVNTGARLCSAAPGGQVLVSRAVLDDCKGGLGDIEFNALPPMTVKNKREPLEVYSVTRVGK